MVKLQRFVPLFLLSLLTAASSPGAPVTACVDGVTRPFDLQKIGADEYISAEVLASLLSADLKWDSRLERGVFTLGSRSVVLIPDNPFVSVDGSMLTVPVTPQFRGGKLFVPILTVSMVFRQVSGKQVRWDPAARVLTIGRSSVNLSGMRLYSSNEETRLVVDMAAPLKYSVRQLSPDNFEVFFERGVLKSDEMSNATGEGFIGSVSGVNVNEGAKLVIGLKKKDLKARTLVLEDPDRLLVAFSSGKKEVSNEKYSLEVVVVDPGHGGRDPGAMGPTGLQEKEVTLDVAKKLADLLRKNLGVKVVLTRSEDEFVSLKERADIANNNEAELFVSVHCNASTNRERGGLETYFLSDAKTDWARAVEARENAVVRFELPEGSKDSASLEYILWDMAQKEFLSESSKLAELVHEELAGRSSVEDRGLKQANFYVLRGCYTPAILVEVAFLSNRKEEKLLRKKAFRQKVAEGIFEGIKEFKKIYERKLNL